MEKNKKKYVYYSGHASNISRLSDVVSNLRHATVLDRFAFFSLNSTFTLPRTLEAEGWFCIKYEEIGRLTGYKERTIKALVKLFEELRLIEKTFHFIQNTRRACLRITKKTKSLLNLPVTNTLTTQKHMPLTPIGAEIKQQQNLTLSQECTSGSAKNALAYNEYREEKKEVNIITRTSRVENPQKPYNTPDNVQKIFDDIGERLAPPQKAKIWGAICNLKKQHNKTISNLSEFVAWVSFSILNAKHQLKNILSFDHQLNSLMKIARSKKGLQRPRGFHNHWDIGQTLKQKNINALNNHKRVKEQEGRAVMKQEVFEAINDGLTHGMDYVVTKKANELWGDESELASLQISKASCIQDINNRMNDNQAIETLLADQPVLKTKQREKNNKEIKAFKNEISNIEEVISTILDERNRAKEQEWKALYA